MQVALSVYTPAESQNRATDVEDYCIDAMYECAISLDYH